MFCVKIENFIAPPNIEVENQMLSVAELVESYLYLPDYEKQ